MLDQLNFVWIKSIPNDTIPHDKININSKIFNADNTMPQLMLLFNSFTCMRLISGGSKCCFVCLNHNLSFKARVSVTYSVLRN